MKRLHLQTVEQAVKVMSRMGTLRGTVSFAGMKLAKRRGEKYRIHHDLTAFIEASKLPTEAKYINFGIKIAEELLRTRVHISGRLAAKAVKRDREIWSTWGY